MTKKNVHLAFFDSTKALIYVIREFSPNANTQFTFESVRDSNLAGKDVSQCLNFLLDLKEK